MSVCLYNAEGKNSSARKNASNLVQRLEVLKAEIFRIYFMENVTLHAKKWKKMASRYRKWGVDIDIIIVMGIKNSFAAEFKFLIFCSTLFLYHKN